MLISSRNTRTDTARVVFDQMPGHPVAQLSWHIKLTITIGDSGAVSVAQQ